MVTHALRLVLRALRVLIAALVPFTCGADGAAPADEPWLARARMLFEQQQYAQAVQAIEAAPELATLDDPSGAEAFLLLGKAYGRLAERQPWYQAAISARRCGKALERAVELDPGHRDALSALQRFYAQAPEILGGGADKAAAVRERLRRLD